MAAVVDADEGVALGERLVGGEELQVARRRPAVQQQHGGRRRVGVAVVADEQLAAVVVRTRRPSGSHGRRNVVMATNCTATLRSPRAETDVTRCVRRAGGGVVAPAAGHDPTGSRPDRLLRRRRAG